ncbi:hypothetical protein C8F01DRAFT_1173879 [Mycena amicta]|nr:hypothetical protein C8F01DRAFT_1173879 [Mycena amicta]
MLKRIISHDPTGNGRVETLYIFEHPSVDNEFHPGENGTERIKSIFRIHILLRNLYIVITLAEILEAFAGMPRAPLERRVVSSPVKDEQRRQADAFLLDKLKRGEFYVDRSQEMEDKANTTSSICSKCRQPAITRSDLKRCGKCLRVWYCSVECQKRDWKEHKRYCGLQHFELDAVAPTPEAPAEFIGCPPAAPGFVRSAALWRQISYLSRDDSQFTDYHYHKDASATGSFTLAWISREMHLTFLVARSRAMATGSRAAVAKILSLLRHPLVSEHFRSNPLPVDKMREQLAREYCIAPFRDWAEVEAVAREFAPVSRGEIDAEIEFMKGRYEKGRVVQGKIVWKVEI